MGSTADKAFVRYAKDPGSIPNMGAMCEANVRHNSIGILVKDVQNTFHSLTSFNWSVLSVTKTGHIKEEFITNVVVFTKNTAVVYLSIFLFDGKKMVTTPESQ